MEFQSKIECPTGIYKLTNKLTKIVYIGQTSIDFLGRWKGHVATLNKQTHRNPYLQRTWNKYGPEVFIASVERYIPRQSNLELFYEELDKQEKQILKQYPKHYNLMEMGEDRMMFSEESRARASYAAKNRNITIKEKETWERNRLAATKSLQAREKRSIAHKKLWADPIQRQKFIDAYNRPETFKKKSDSIKKAWSPERRARQTELNLKMHSNPEFKEHHRQAIKAAHARNKEKYQEGAKQGWKKRHLFLETREGQTKEAERIRKILTTKTKKKLSIGAECGNRTHFPSLED